MAPVTGRMGHCGRAPATPALDWETIASENEPLPDYVPDCYFCPGNQRVSGKRNPPYTGTFVFDNDHPCVGMSAPTELNNPSTFYHTRPATGIARVICFSPQHNMTLAEMEPEAVEEVVATWQRTYRDLGNRPEINHVLIFENKGEAVGYPIRIHTDRCMPLILFSRPSKRKHAPATGTGKKQDGRYSRTS
jgi:galactose-1-phosphate uridylyltransferase (family 1)